MTRADGAQLVEMDIDEGAIEALPDAPYALGVQADSVRHRVGSLGQGQLPRSMANLTLQVLENGQRVHQEMLVDGDTAFFRDLEIKLVAVTGRRARLQVLRSPFLSTLPRPAAR